MTAVIAGKARGKRRRRNGDKPVVCIYDIYCLDVSRDYSLVLFLAIYINSYA